MPRRRPRRSSSVTTLTRSLTLAWVGVLWLVLSADEVSAVEVVRGDRLGKVAAFGDRYAFSRYDASAGGYVLMAGRGAGAARRLPVRVRARPFDVDLGPTSTGKTAAVYSRCSGNPAQANPNYGFATGCDVFEYTFADRTERRVRAISSRARSEILPTLWRGRIAFARPISSTKIGRYRIRLLMYDRRSGMTRRLQIRRQGNGASSNGPLALDLKGRRLAYVWSRTGGPQCPPSGPSVSDVGQGGEVTLTDANVAMVGRTTRLVAEGCDARTESAARIVGAGWSGDKVVYANEQESRDDATRTSTVTLFNPATASRVSLPPSPAGPARLTYVSATERAVFTVFRPAVVPSREEWSIGREMIPGR